MTANLLERSIKIKRFLCVFTRQLGTRARERDRHSALKNAPARLIRIPHARGTRALQMWHFTRSVRCRSLLYRSRLASFQGKWNEFTRLSTLIRAEIPDQCQCSVATIRIKEKHLFLLDSELRLSLLGIRGDALREFIMQML
jgi:hypothetical protein